MIVGVPKEIKTDEYRVSMTPAGVHDLITRGHQVYWKTKLGKVAASAIRIIWTREPKSFPIRKYLPSRK